MSYLNYNLPRPSHDYAYMIVQTLLDKEYDNKDEAAHHARMMFFLLQERAWRWLKHQLSLQGKKIDDYKIDVINNFEPYEYYHHGKIKLRVKKEDIASPLEQPLFPAGNYDQEHSWWVLFSGEDDTGKPLTCSLSINAQPIDEDKLNVLTDEKRYSDVELLLREQELYLRADIERQFKQFNDSVAGLPDKAQRAINNVNSHIRSQGNNLPPLQKRLNDLEEKHEDLTFSYKLLSYVSFGCFFAMTAALGVFAWLMISRLT